MPSTPYTRHLGMTLLEVIAGLAILGTLFTAMLFAQRDHRAQFDRAQQKIAAVEAADLLLNHWWQDQADIPQEAHGRLDEEIAIPSRQMANFTWRTSRIASTNADQLGVQIIRLEIFTSATQDDSESTPASGSFRGDFRGSFRGPGAFVDVVVPQEGFSHEE